MRSADARPGWSDTRTFDIVRRSAGSAEALENGYQAQDTGFNEGELLKIGRHAFLVAYGLVCEARVIVTREVSKRTKRLGASKLPGACDDCGVKWTTDFEMYRLLDFNLRGR